MKNGCVKLPVIVLAVVFAVSFTGCSSTPAASGPGAERQYSTITFRNETGSTIYFLYISERIETTWGEDWLGENVIADGSAYTARLLMGEYDVMAEDNAGDTYTFWIKVDENSGTFTIEASDKD
jgi:hypothetical protein